MEEGLFHHVGELQHLGEVWQMEKEFHQRQRLERYRYGQLQSLSICTLCEDYYSQEKHIGWIKTQACGDYMDVNLGSKHTQKC